MFFMLSKSDNLKKYYSNSDKYINIFNKYIGDIQDSAYKNTYNLSNPVLSRNPYTSNLFQRLLFENINVKSPTPLDILTQIVKYYINSIKQFLLYILNGFCFYFSELNNIKLNYDLKKEVLVIDVFFLVEKIINEKKFNDQYFKGLYKILDKKNKQYIFLPVFYGLPSKRISDVFMLFNILKKDKKKILTEYELLGFFDYIRLLKFIIVYPFEVIKLFLKTGDDLIDRIYASELISTLDKPQFLNYSKYLIGKRLSYFFDNKFSLISWFENQVIDRNLYRGIKEKNLNNPIYGCQPFIYSSAQMNMIPIKNDNVLADAIFVTGKYYLDKMNKRNLNINYRIGPSFRYQRIFKDAVEWNKKEKKLIALPYDIKDSDDVLEMCSDTILSEESINIKLHPATFSSYREKVTRTLPVCWKIINSNLYDIFFDTKLIIGTGSGSLVEAASLGLSVIVVANQSTFTSNPMPEYGKGKIWDIVFDKYELEICYNNLLRYRLENIAEIKEISDKYKSLFFTKPCEESITKAFSLDN